MVSVIISVYNEEKTIESCLLSLSQQSYQPLEIIAVDDGSVDSSKFKVQSSLRPELWIRKRVKLKLKNLRIISQSHQGPGRARNLGARHAKGEILVFVDADMTFDKDFIKYLVDPIINGKSKGTFTKKEFVSNWDNIWARCWNYNEGIAYNRRVSRNYPDVSPVFRAILKSEFERVGGFDDIGFTDDWTLSRKLSYQATEALGAICFHKNPETLREVFQQARWIGKNEFIIGSFIRKIVSLIRFNPLLQTFRSLSISFKYREPLFLIFQTIYYSGIFISVCRSFSGEQKSK